MIISTPKIDDPNDSNTITMNNTLANAKITADFSYIEPPKKTKLSSSSASIASSNTTANTNENSAQPRHSHARTSTSAHGYVNRVGFDTLSCNDTSEYAFTLQTRTEGYKRTKHTRTFLVGTDMNNYSAHALQWVVENMVEDGDEIVALRVVPMELRDSWYKGHNHHHGQETAARSEANKIISSIREHNIAGKEISIIVEIIVGVVRDTFQQMIKLYEPDMLVVGSRGRSSVKGILSGSVSRYCLNQCLVPVIVVRPERKLNKSKNKAKGIFRRRSSITDLEDHGYQPHPTQPIHMSTSNFDFRNSLTVSRGDALASHTALFPSATIHAGDKFPGRTQPSPTITPLSSLFAPMPPVSKAATPAPASSSASISPLTPASASESAAIAQAAAPSNRTITLPPQPVRSSMSPPPEGMIKLRKSLTIDGTGKESKESFGKSSGGFLSSSIFGPILGRSDKQKSKKRNSQI
ncbi:hypothetical protein BGX27_011400 [Mortierella sp. AM989]|nr:hypothetical protein BGX27_011400 [Mortierella sp. AM989]